MTASWQLVLLWGVLVGVGTGSISMGFVATVADALVRGAPRPGHRRAHRGERDGAADLPAGRRRGHRRATAGGWASLDRGRRGAGRRPAGAGVHAQLPAGQGPHRLRGHDGGRARGRCPPGSFRAAFDGLRIGAQVPAFWLLAGSFAICGMTTNGLIGTHFIPAANDHGMPTTVAAGLLATIGILDVAGTIFSGWLTDRVDPRAAARRLLPRAAASRCCCCRRCFRRTPSPSTWVFVIFYGLDWVATVPPTIVLCRNYFGARTPVVFGWVFASHQLGAAVAAAGAGLAARSAGRLRPGVLPRLGAVCRRRGALPQRAESAGQRRLTGPGRSL